VIRVQVPVLIVVVGRRFIICIGGLGGNQEERTVVKTAWEATIRILLQLLLLLPLGMVTVSRCCGSHVKPTAWPHHKTARSLQRASD